MHIAKAPKRRKPYLEDVGGDTEDDQFYFDASLEEKSQIVVVSKHGQRSADQLLVKVDKRVETIDEILLPMIFSKLDKLATALNS